MPNDVSAAYLELSLDRENFIQFQLNRVVIKLTEYTN